MLGINEQTIREHYEIRAVLESEAVAKASRPGTDISRIAQVHYAAEKALADNNSAEYSDLNQAFHMEIWNAAGNENAALQHVERTVDGAQGDRRRVRRHFPP